ncbi:MAG: protein kinase [Acidobacteriota bacterium]
MPLSIGDKLGHYEIVAPLGKGGMGEVYRALDTQLEREVAVKVLPYAMANDPERLARFDREAKILAALNHPNIAVIYGLVESSGQRALVMELVQGETLADRIKRGALPQDESLTVARQIAEALEAAHEKNIVHRDLKPGNVMITPAGVVKVLDFGLAAMASPASSVSGDPNNSPTLTLSMTQAGTIMGTAAYMSPEQAAGATVDRRADIWSYGVVLWEMLTGKRLFDGGESISHTLADVLRAPINLEPIRSAPVRKLLKRCLDRSLKTRLQSIAEARIAIDEIQSTPESPAQPSGAGLQPEAASRAARLPWAIAAVALAAVTALATIHFRETPPELRLVNTTLLPPDNADYDFSAPFAMPAISPDGTRIVYGAKAKDGKQQLWLRRLDSATAQPLPGTESAATPFWSPDSRWVAFGQENRLKKIDIQGGPPVPITDITNALRGGSWNADGVILFSINGTDSPVFRVAASGGAAARATPAGGRQPWFLPDGRHFLYIDSKAGDMPVHVGSLDEPTKAGKVVAQAHSPAAFALGHLLYLRENTLMAQPFDVDQLATTGEAMPIAEGILTYTNLWRIPVFAVSPAGLLVYATGASRGQSRLVWKDRTGRVLGNLGDWTGRIGGISLSPDGKRLAANMIDRSGNDDLWIFDVARGIPTRFTFDPKNDLEPHWSPDGNTLYFGSDRKGRFDLFRKASNGTGTEELLLEDSVSKYVSSVSPDGKLLLFRRNGEKTGSDLLILLLTPTQGGAPGEPRKVEPKVFLQTPFNELRAQFSPDGQLVAYQSNESGVTQVYAAPFPGPGGKRQISADGGGLPRWRRDGKEIFYVTQDGQLMAAEVAVRNGTLEVGKVQKLFDGIIMSRGITYDVAADGQKFLVVDDGVSASRPLTLLQNWTAALRK